MPRAAIRMQPKPKMLPIAAWRQATLAVTAGAAGVGFIEFAAALPA
jgi:hypothetical protein